MIPPLLISVPECRRATDLRILKLLPDVGLDGVPRHRVQGEGFEGTTVLWIDKVTDLIRGIDETSSSSDSQSTTRIRFLPEIDISLPPEALSLVPPGAAAS